MKILGLVLSIAATATGLVAAWYWLKASRVAVRPVARSGLGGGAIATPGTPWLAGSLIATQAAGALNATAARWTAASVVLGGVASILGQFPL